MDDQRSRPDRPGSQGRALKPRRTARLSHFSDVRLFLIG